MNKVIRLFWREDKKDVRVVLKMKNDVILSNEFIIIEHVKEHK